MNIRYEWDEDKRRETLDGRELDFADVGSFFEWDTAIIFPSDRYGEPRWVAYGYFRARLHVVVYTQRGATGEIRRIISFRPASQKEVNEYGRRI